MGRGGGRSGGWGTDGDAGRVGGRGPAEWTPEGEWGAGGETKWEDGGVGRRRAICSCARSATVLPAGGGPGGRGSDAVLRGCHAHSVHRARCVSAASKMRPKNNKSINK